MPFRSCTHSLQLRTVVMTTMAMLSNDSERRTGLRQTGPAPGRTAKTTAGSGNRAVWALTRQSRYGPSTSRHAPVPRRHIWRRSRNAMLIKMHDQILNAKQVITTWLHTLPPSPARRARSCALLHFDNDSCKEERLYDISKIQNHLSVTMQFSSLHMLEFT